MKKLYYSIGEVSKITGIEAHVLRYWESVFPELNPMKGKSGNRRYREQDLAIVLQLQDLIHNKGYKTAGAQKVLKEKINAGSNTIDSSSSAESLPALTPELRRELTEMRHLLQTIAEKL
jgi:DNA-binding transcriptional MerR regulator